LRAEVSKAGVDLGKARGRIAEMRDTLARRIAEWGDERGALHAAARALADNKQRLQNRLVDVENQAAWSARQIAELVEKEATAASELAQGRQEIANLGTDLQSAEAELAHRHAASEEFVVAAKRLLAVDALPSMDLSAVLGELRQQLRKTERELDRAEADRDQLLAALDVRASQRRPIAGRFANFFRGLLARRPKRREELEPLGGGP
jgi:chromosome segregation ATPase